MLYLIEQRGKQSGFSKNSLNDLMEYSQFNQKEQSFRVRDVFISEMLETS